MTSRSALALLFVASTALAQTPSLQTTAEAYLATNEYMLALGRSQCGWVAKQGAPTSAVLLDREIMPYFPAEARAKFNAFMVQATAQGQAFVEDAIRQTMQKADRNTACGYVAGVAVTLYGRARDDFRAAATKRN